MSIDIGTPPNKNIMNLRSENRKISLWRLSSAAIVLFALTVSFVACEEKDSDKPLGIETEQVTNITSSTATVGGKVTGDGGSGSIESGICWSTSRTPDISGAYVKNTSGKESFTSEITGLIENETYYVRAYITNGEDVVYGEEKSFTTKKSETYVGDVVLTTQEEVETFGKNGYTKISGKLLIQEKEGTNDPITDLTSLFSLEEVEVAVVVEENASLKTLSGLDNIHRVGVLSISTNHQLQDLAPLAKLKTVEGVLNIYFNNQLKSLKGLHNVETVGEKLIIQINQGLTTIDAFQKLKAIGSLFLLGNSSLKDMAGLSNVEKVEGLVFISSNGLETLEGLQSLTSVGSDFEILVSRELQSIKQLEQLEIIEGSLRINGANNLSDFSGLGALKKVKSIEIKGTSIYDLKGLDSLEGEDVDFLIEENENLKSFCDLKDYLRDIHKGKFITKSNGYNPTKDDVVNGVCSMN